MIELLFGLPYCLSPSSLVGILMIVYVTFGGMIATTWVQIIKAVLLLSGASSDLPRWCCGKFNFNVERDVLAKAIEVHPKHLKRSC